MAVYKKSFIASLEEDFRQVDEMLAKLQDSNAVLLYTQELAQLKTSLDQLNPQKEVLSPAPNGIATSYAHSLYHSSTMRDLDTLLGNDEAILEAPTTSVPIPPRIFTVEELAQDYNGKANRPAYVAVNGFVFDVTHSPLWSNGTHRTLQAGMNHSHHFTIFHCSDIYELSTKVPLMGRLLE